MPMQFSKDGVLLADVPNAGAARIDPNARSGNARHDIRSGKFAPGSRKKPESPAPPNVDAMEYRRMMDAVRDAAREFDNLDVGDLKEFLAARARDSQAVDIEQFSRLVAEQRKADMVDMIDQKMRAGGILPKGRRSVKVSAPRGYLKKSLGALTASDVEEVKHRLVAKGHDQADVDNYFAGRVRTEETGEEETNELQASDLIWLTEDLEESISAGNTDVVALAETLMRNIPAPVVNLSPIINVEAPKPMKREIVRDSKTNLLTEIREVPDGS